MGWWATSVRIFNAIRTHGPPSRRGLAERTGLAKSRVHRHLQAMERRDRHPESSLWETEAGRAWLIRLVVATLLMCGLKRGVGAETRSEGCSRLRLEAQGGGSPSALRTGRHLRERRLLDPTAAWEQDGMAHGEIRPVLGAGAATFLQRMLLGCMALATGEVLRDEVATARRFDTWCDRAHDRLTTFGPTVLSLGSDRAKALSKRAETGRHCLRIPDWFPLSHDLAQGESLAICGRLRHAKRGLEHATQRLATLQKNAPAADAHGGQGRAQVAACTASVTHWQAGG